MIRYRDLLSDTICSPITPPGYSGVAVIRVSGEKAFSATQNLIENKNIQFESHRSYLTSIVDSEEKKIDQVLITAFEKGKSFTGDETVEISCHGNPLLVNAITKRFLEEGCRTAERGEFSFRAYYNGKIDLVQAESIQSLVTTKVKRGSQNFVDQLQGELSKEFEQIQDQLVTAMAHLEATIDFVEQDIDPSDFKAVENLVDKTQIQINKLIKSYDTGKSLQKDLNILLLGQTNAGKSSLFNQFVKSDRAIVTDIEGTTRDIITEQKFIGNNSVQFVDSAGLRETSDQVETMGIQRSLDQADKADLILFVIDTQNPKSTEFLTSLPMEKTLIVFNKADLFHSEEELNSVRDRILLSCDIPQSFGNTFFVSSLNGDGIDALVENIEGTLLKDNADSEGTVVSQARHFDHLNVAETHLSKSLELLKLEESPDLISQELLLGLTEIHQILGKEYDDEVLDKIFSQFCIGK